MNHPSHAVTRNCTWHLLDNLLETELGAPDIQVKLVSHLQYPFLLPNSKDPDSRPAAQARIPIECSPLRTHHSPRQSSSPWKYFDTMSEDRNKKSLRSGPKRKGRPTISAPRQISNPIPQDGSSRGAGVRPGPGDTPLPRARPLQQGSGKAS